MNPGLPGVASRIFSAIHFTGAQIGAAQLSWLVHLHGQDLLPGSSGADMSFIRLHDTPYPCGCLTQVLEVL